MVAWWKAKGGQFKYRVRFQMMAWWKAKGGEISDDGMVEGKGGDSLDKEIDFR